MITRSLSPLRGTTATNVSVLGGTVVLGTAGAITSQPGAKACGFTVAKTANKTGRYSITFYKPFKTLLSFSASILGADDAAFGVTTGTVPLWRLNAVTTAGTITLQLVRSDTAADAEATTNALVCLSFMVAE